MAAIYDKYTHNHFMQSDDIENSYDSLAYAKYVRPEMLQLYEFLKTSKLTNLQIKSHQQFCYNTQFGSMVDNSVRGLSGYILRSKRSGRSTK